MLLGMLVMLVLGSLAHAQTSRNLPACSQYASQTGSGSACTDANPCKVSTMLNVYSNPGAILCLKDGEYTGGESMIQVPANFAGTAEQRITIRAVNRGKVWINGRDGERPVHLRGTYGILDGVHVKLGDNVNVRLDGAASRWIIRYVVSYDVGGGGDANLQVSGNNNQIEDSAFFGRGRKTIAAGAAGGNGNTVRRTWANWEANTHESSHPANTSEVGYGQDGVTFENVYLTWNAKGSSLSGTEYEGITEIMATQGSQFLGSILYLTGNETYQPWTVTFGVVDAGSHAQQGDFHPTKNLVFKHNLAFIHPSHPRFGSVSAYGFMECTDTGCQDGTNNIITESVGVAGAASSFSSRSWTVSNMQLGNSMAAAIGAGKSVWTDSKASPGLCYRYVNRQKTTTPQWPWPLDNQLDQAMRDLGLPGFKLTAMMEQLFGPIPAQCKGTAPDPGPGPGPGDTTPPEVEISMPKPGQVVSTPSFRVAANAYDNSGMVSIQFLLDNAPLGAPDTTEPYFIDWNTAGIASGAHTISARATDSAGNITNAAPVTFQVQSTTPPDPQQPGPFTCTGHIPSIPGTLTIECTPTPGARR